MATVKSTLKGINRNSLTNNADLIECQELINLRFKEGKWQNVKKKTTQFDIGIGVEALYAHQTSEGLFLIIYHEPTGQVQFRKFGSFYEIFALGRGKSVRFESLGNILICFDDTSEQMHYILWDIELSSYRYIGDAIPPQININFNCYQREYTQPLAETFAEFAANWSNSSESPYIPVGTIDYNTSWEDRLKQVLTTLSIAYAKWEEEGVCNGYVAVRYAYELFDGSIVAHSSPMLIHIRGKVTDKYSNGLNVAAAILNNNTKVYLGIDAGELHYSISSGNAETISALQTKYRGIVRGVNIYVSKIYHKYESYFESADNDSYYYGRRGGSSTPSAWEVDGIDSSEFITPELIVKDTQLYKVASIPLDKLGVCSSTKVDMGDLTKIHTNDSMPSENLSNIRLFGRASFVYNSRLWLGNIVSVFTPPVKANTYNITSYAGGNLKVVSFEFILKTTQGNIRLRSEAYSNSETHLNLPFMLYYPDSRAVKFNILVKPDGDTNTYICFTADLTAHPTFNYAYCFMGEQPDLNVSIPTETTSTPGGRTRETDNARMSMASIFSQVTWKYPTLFDGYEIAHTNYSTFIVDHNRVQVSSVNNPMYFEAKNSYRVGNGNVLNFMSNARPLTQLQFGQHPMFVFTSTGVFALEIGTGEVMVLRISPVTDEVITGSPTAYNGNVIFPTDKGIFALYGDSTKLISQALHGEVVSNLANNEAFLALYTDLFGSNDYISQVDFIQYLNGSKLAVDYINEELIVSNPEYNYSYILGLESKVWSKRSESFKLFSNSWPTTYATIERNNSVDLVELGKESGNLPVLIISRPSGFGSTDDKKIHHATIRTVITGNTGRITGLVYGQLNEEGLIFLNNGKSVIQPSIVDLHISKTSRSCRYTVLVFGCKPTQLLLDRLDCEVTNSWGG